ncbi:MAG: hypothetical protein AAGU21_09995 [Solidesulfovibrio sp.]|uniref:hypothetical protein n=1 Tax=Solidesulfovibrio sp. TaxID=2910990 RepID=UPI0031587998
MKKRTWLLALLGFSALVVAYFSYLSLGFTGTRCEGAKVRHGEVTDEAGDCLACHKKATPKVAQDWFESKHGMLLVKCYVCHGLPDGKGSVPFSATPSAAVACQRCHAPAMERMAEKFGVRDGCDGCHGFHTNSLHHDTYAKSVSKEKAE